MYADSRKLQVKDVELEWQRKEVEAPTPIGKLKKKKKVITYYQLISQQYLTDLCQLSFVIKTAILVIVLFIQK